MVLTCRRDNVAHFLGKKDTSTPTLVLHLPAASHSEQTDGDKLVDKISLRLAMKSSVDN